MSQINIPIWEKVNLTIEEAAAYFNIGENRLRALTDQQGLDKYVLRVGNKRLIKRKQFEAYLSAQYTI